MLVLHGTGEECKKCSYYMVQVRNVRYAGAMVQLRNVRYAGTVVQVRNVRNARTTWYR